MKIITLASEPRLGERSVHEGVEGHVACGGMREINSCRDPGARYLLGQKGPTDHG